MSKDLFLFPFGKGSLLDKQWRVSIASKRGWRHCGVTVRYEGGVVRASAECFR